jgi:exodeoxyribonuclease-1
MQAFHATDWNKRQEIANAIKDDRQRELGSRLIFENAPSALNKLQRGQLEVWLHNRRHGRDGVQAGRTLTAAQDELAKLIAENGASQETTAIESWLATLA